MEEEALGEVEKLCENLVHGEKKGKSQFKAVEGGELTPLLERTGDSPTAY